MIECNQYANDVISGKIVACKFVIDACSRHLNDIERSKKASYPYYFDENEAKIYTTFISNLNLWKSSWANKPVDLQGWQYFIIQVLLGWKKKGDKTRRFRKAYIEMARKNAKTTLAAMIALAILYIDNESGGQIYSAATKEEQAKIVVTDMAGIINATPLLKPSFTFRKSKEGYSRIMLESTYSFVRPLGRDSDTQDGFDPYIGIIDEYHEHNTDGLINVIESGMGARREPLLLIITTAGFDKTKPCYSYRKNITDILEGHIEDEQLFGIVYTLDEGDDFRDKSNWIKSNPNMNVSIFETFLEQQMVDALNRGSKLPAFLTKNMNIWVDSSTTWIDSNAWEACVYEVEMDELRDKECWIGLDLASVADITAMVCLFNDVNGRQYYKPFFFAPKNAVKERGKKDGVDYAKWAREGYLILTDGGAGKATDYKYIKEKILWLCENTNVKNVAFDKWNSSSLINELNDLCVPTAPYSQGIASMSFPTKEFERDVLQGNLAHDGNPIMSWMLRNVELSFDTNDNVKIDKKKSTQKVDGPVAAVMAKGVNIVDNANEIVYI
jgi:phage terminase large subunit-like protein